MIFFRSKNRINNNNLKKRVINIQIDLIYRPYPIEIIAAVFIPVNIVGVN